MANEKGPMGPANYTWDHALTRVNKQPVADWGAFFQLRSTGFVLLLFLSGSNILTFLLNREPVGDMADCSYNYNPSYHPYTYSLIYPPGPEKSHGGLHGWADTGGGDLGTYTDLTQAYYTARSQEQPPLRGPEQHFHYPGSGGLYLGPRADTRGHEPRQDASDSASDSETTVSPGG